MISNCITIILIYYTVSIGKKKILKFAIQAKKKKRGKRKKRDKRHFINFRALPTPL